MNKNKKPDVSYKEYILSLIAVAIISAGIVYSLNKQGTQSVADFQRAYPNLTDLEKINKTYEAIIDNYVGDVDKKELVNGAIVGMTQALDDPYSDYLTGQSANDLDDTISGSFDGIGAVMTIKNKQVVIAEAPIKNSPAAKAKLEMGDKIIKVDNSKTKDKALTEVVNAVRGKSGTEVVLEIERNGETFEKTLKRAKVALETVTGTVSEKDKEVGIVTIASFAEQTANEFKKTVMSLRKSGVTKFIFDVRQNPGGVLDQVAIMSSMLLDDNEIIVQFENKDKQKNKIVAGKSLDDGFKIKEPSVVLIDGGSASASEIFAAALNESVGISLVGDQTFGKGTVQSVQNLSEESELKLTTNKWLTPKGEWVHQKGIKPTVAVDYSDYKNLGPIDTNQTYQLNMTGKSLRNINGLLSYLGYDVDKTADDFNQNTEKAVRDIQQKVGITMTGIIDKETAEAIQKLTSERIQEDDRALTEGLKILAKQIPK